MRESWDWIDKYMEKERRFMGSDKTQFSLYKRRTEDFFPGFRSLVISLLGLPSLVSHFGQRKALRSQQMQRWMNRGKIPKKKRPCVSAFVVDRGDFDPNVSGGVARSKAKCCALPNGEIDIVVSLQVYTVDCPKETIIEIMQFEKHQDKKYQNTENDKDPYGDLLKWLIPLDKTISQPPRSLPPPLVPSSGISSTAAQASDLFYPRLSTLLIRPF